MVYLQFYTQNWDGLYKHPVKEITVNFISPVKIGVLLNNNLFKLLICLYFISNKCQRFI